MLHPEQERDPCTPVLKTRAGVMAGNLDWINARRGGGTWSPIFGSHGGGGGRPASGGGSSSGGGWYHLRVKSISRAAGQSAVAAAAYRLGERLEDQATGQVQDYTRRSGVITTFSLAREEAPDWATEPEALWNGVEASENRKNSKLAREYELALPAAVSPEAREEIARSFTEELVERYGVAASVALHAPSGRESELNFHAHILTTTRMVGEGGFGPKTRILDDQQTGPEEVKYLRGFAAELINRALEDAGVDERVDHRSFADRGIERLPTVHMGVAASAMERRGQQSIRGALNQEVRDHNAHIRSLLTQLAALHQEVVREEERALDARFGEPAPASSSDPPADVTLQDAATPTPTEAERKAAWEEHKRQATNSIEDAAPFREHMRETGSMRDASASPTWFGRLTELALYMQERAIELAHAGWQKVLSWLPGERPSDPEIER